MVYSSCPPRLIVVAFCVYVYIADWVSLIRLVILYVRRGAEKKVVFRWIESLDLCFYFGFKSCQVSQVCMFGFNHNNCGVRSKYRFGSSLMKHIYKTQNGLQLIEFSVRIYVYIREETNVF